MSNDEMRMMRPSTEGKHFKVTKVYGGFIDVLQKDPPNDYEGKHRLDYRPGLNARSAKQVWLGCRSCVIALGGLPDGRLVIKSN
jgi:hypothetical protein